MLTALVTFTLDPQQQGSPESQTQLLQQSAPKYQKIPGLIRKYFIHSGSRAGGWYEWENQAFADAYFTDAWAGYIKEQYGAWPEIEYFDCPCVVDNSANTIVFAAGAANPASD